MSPESILSPVLATILSTMPGSIQRLFHNWLLPVKITTELCTEPPYSLGFESPEVPLDYILRPPTTAELTDKGTIWVDKVEFVVDIANVSDNEIYVSALELNQSTCENTLKSYVQYIPQGDNTPDVYVANLDDAHPHLDKCGRGNLDHTLRVAVRDFFGRRHGEIPVAPRQSTRLVFVLNSPEGSWQLDPKVEIRTPYRAIHRRLCRNPQRVISGASVPEENRRWTLGAGDEVTGEGTYTSNIEVPQEALVVRS